MFKKYYSWVGLQVKLVKVVNIPNRFLRRFDFKVSETKKIAYCDATGGICDLKHVNLSVT